MRAHKAKVRGTGARPGCVRIRPRDPSEASDVLLRVRAVLLVGGMFIGIAAILRPMARPQRCPGTVMFSAQQRQRCCEAGFQG